MEVNKTLPPSADTAHTAPLIALPAAVAEASARVVSVVGAGGGGGVGAGLRPAADAADVAVVRTIVNDAAASAKRLVIVCMKGLRREATLPAPNSGTQVR